MEVMRSLKYLATVTLILLSTLNFAVAQPGFISIDCGGKTSRIVAENNIRWVTDDNYTEDGYSVQLNDTSLPFYLQSYRVFPKPLNKSCYHLPVPPNLPFLLRLSFVSGNYSNQIPDFKYTIETQDMLALRNITNQIKAPIFQEMILVSGGGVLHVCLIRTSEDVDPFITSIELRNLQQGMYEQVSAGKMLYFGMRINAGAEDVVRFPEDPFDRLWVPLSNIKGAEKLTLKEQIFTNNTANLIPTIVMQTAISTEEDTIEIQFSRNVSNSSWLMYFAELEPSESRIFTVLIDNQIQKGPIKFERNYSATELDFELKEETSSFTLVKAFNSTRGPLINAFEMYQIVSTSPATSSTDVEALSDLNETSHLKSWISDPCFAVPWEGIRCNNTSNNIVRVSEINLSRRNLRGMIPPTLSQLTELIHMSLDNNYLTGQLPDLSNLTKLQTLYIQNNNLSGEIPNWIFQLHNLKELSIENNDFSGVIPKQLLTKPSLNFQYGGNKNLCTKKEDCTSKSHTMGVVLGVSLPIIFILTFLLVIMLYRKKYLTFLTHRTISQKDFSMVLVPNSSKSCSYTLEEMVTATENFSHKIGQGGFGLVFLGTLKQGKQIAVKVMSLFSKQGVAQFLNEVELLSRIHHRNLVSLLGYCNETRDLMLVYEYMSGGSLSDNIYDEEKNSKLTWRIKLKIALDAAQGLEYLHLGCTPKIIHRDVKTANILLDANFNGKLADFGLSRVSIDGEASHVTTTVKGTAGYLDPKYYSTQMLTEKSDVYSFGVVLLEIICGRRPIDLKLSQDKILLIDWVTPYVHLNNEMEEVTEIVDKNFDGKYNVESIKHMVKLGIRCVAGELSFRPTMTEVVGEIKEALKFEEENNEEIVAIVGHRDTHSNLGLKNYSYMEEETSSDIE
ncbi:hypothetical protein SUGI_0754920 [Cryptomeria japonica]|uniref:probable LRR receptor-like serine/threonine-protein kinase At1g67720 isoform X2 n=1 Tax=Cryptomeria japonica TaxID=3369 RepID=UPI0024149DE2|nr:probable LRR receptor-like serine/threonine-protein kinase At1g67720 isoform X2 [Cryptomeria japonica]GLJ37219.1 hypothetical protein SUGI_0754920 [Cryptomeria japonica]